MIKFAEKIVDITNDEGFKVLYSEAKKTDFPDELKKLKVLSADELNLLPDGDFALIFVGKDGNTHRKFPKPDQDNAIVSAVYLTKTYKDLPSDAAATAAHNLLGALSKTSVGGSYLGNLKSKLYDLQDLNKNIKTNIYREAPTNLDMELRKGQGDELKVEKVSRMKLADKEFAIIAKKAGVIRRLFPIDTVENIKKAEAYFDKNENLFTPEQRNMFSKAVRDQAAALNVKIGSAALPKYASKEWSDIATLAITNRVNHLRNQLVLEKTASVKTSPDTSADMLKAAQAYNELATNVGKMDIDKYASLLSNIDKAFGMTKLYGKAFPDAYASTYCQKTAFFTGKGNDLSSLSTMFSGIKVTANDIKSLDLGRLGGLIDENIFSELMKDPIAVFDSLPIPYKNVIVGALKK